MGRRDGWKDFYPRARLYVDYYTYRGRQYALSIITDSPRFKTASGIGVGSSVTQLRRRIDVTCDLVDSYTCQHEPAGTGQALTLFDIDRTTRRVVRISIVGN
jgi:hypothetical protein